jgi:hypothetical protein
LQLKKNAAGEVGFQVLVGGGMGRTPIIATEINAFVPWQQILVFIEAIVRVYNLAGRRDNLYKARIKILVKAEGQKFVDAVNAEFAAILADDAGGHEHLIPEAELARVKAGFVDPEGLQAAPAIDVAALNAEPAYQRWLQRNVHGHRVSGHRAVTLSLKRVGIPPGDTTADVMDTAAALAEHLAENIKGIMETATARAATPGGTQVVRVRRVACEGFESLFDGQVVLGLLPLLVLEAGLEDIDELALDGLPVLVLRGLTLVCPEKTRHDIASRVDETVFCGAENEVGDLIADAGGTLLLECVVELVALLGELSKL